MKNWVVVLSVLVFSLFYCFPAESVNRNVMLIKILNEVKVLSEKSAKQDKKIDEILESYIN